MGKGGGGGFDAGPMLEYGQKALDIQKDVFEKGVGWTDPWYQTGVGALGELRYGMGLGGTGEYTAGGMNRGDVYNMLRGEYTTQMGGPAGDWGPRSINVGTGRFGGGDVFKDFGSVSDLTNFLIGRSGSIGSGQEQKMSHNRAYKNASKMWGQADPTSLMSESVDQAGLRDAVDAYMLEHAVDTDDPRFGALTRKFSLEDFEADPGYQFRLGEGEKAIERAMSSRGKTFSPEALKALDQYSQGMATEEYGKAYGRFEGEKADLYNRLANMSGMGQTATAQRTGLGQAYAGQAADIYGGMGSAMTEANIARASQPSMFDKLLNVGGQVASAYFMSDSRLKENIEQVGTEKGFPLYHFNYKGSKRKFSGVMAQDVEKTRPDAVMTMINGYKAVNYGALGIEMKEVS